MDLVDQASLHFAVVRCLSGNMRCRCNPVIFQSSDTLLIDLVYSRRQGHLLQRNERATRGPVQYSSWPGHLQEVHRSIYVARNCAQ